MPIEHGDSLRALLAADRLDALRSSTGERVDHAQVEFLPPIHDADKIFCVGLNYRGHLTETGTPLPTHPSLFMRFNSSQVGHEQPVIAPSISTEFDYEGELAVVIGRTAWRVPAERAMEHVAGYSCFAENSVRDFQMHSRQATPGKNFLMSGAFGPWLTTADEVPDPAALRLTSRLNGEVVQDESVSALVFDIPALIAYISSFTVLLPGDVISTGTPDGVGFLRDPKVWLKPGDLFEVDIPGVGLLRNRVADETGIAGGVAA
ncbi:fumarylacetoacetate hydrolase family protein [Sphingomonas profundi]|uniref:fumarylacetoacetate hydrolase family protein n=1 Tax=Alterirhizorhabdus profundi TaxID=2681549 RepID=UPI001E652CAD|nr:fumarylacetoacetate hydrolase family protein [Sphingomonas profundi]